MKSIMTFIFALSCVFSFTMREEARAQQSAQSQCGTPLNPSSTPTKVLTTTSDEGAPYYIPAYGTVRALVVYVDLAPFCRQGEKPVTS